MSGSGEKAMRLPSHQGAPYVMYSSSPAPIPAPRQWPYMIRHRLASGHSFCPPTWLDVPHGDQLEAGLVERVVREHHVRLGTIAKSVGSQRLVQPVPPCTQRQRIIIVQRTAASDSSQYCSTISGKSLGTLVSSSCGSAPSLIRWPTGSPLATWHSNSKWDKISRMATSERRERPASYKPTTHHSRDLPPPLLADASVVRPGHQGDGTRGARRSLNDCP